MAARAEPVVEFIPQQKHAFHGCKANGTGAWLAVRGLTVYASGTMQGPQRIVVLNPKGGSGKTTIAINLASHYATRGLTPLLMDFDPQGSSMRWIRKRPPNLPEIRAVAAFERDSRLTRSFQLRAPEGTARVIVDTPAAVPAHGFPDLTRDAHKIIVPVMPSDIDIHAASKVIADLLLVAKIRRGDHRIGVIANRVRRNTLVYQALMRFLGTLGIPIVATFRDSQSYVRSAELGLGIHEMKSYLVREDLEQWEPLIGWLEEGVQAGVAPGVVSAV
ncbi:MAG: hypothetical protein AMXMBFR37_21190 [Steroidobacteraceae bacterium]